MKDFSKFGPYVKLDESVIGSGAKAVQYLPDDLRAVAERATTFFPEKEIVLPSGAIDWKKGIRLTKYAGQSEGLRQQDLYRALKSSRDVRLEKMRAREQYTPEFYDKVDTSALAGFSASSEAAEVAGAAATAGVHKMEEARREQEEAKAAGKNKMLKSLVPVLLLIVGFLIAKRQKWI